MSCCGEAAPARRCPLLAKMVVCRACPRYFAIGPVRHACDLIVPRGATCNIDYMHFLQTERPCPHPDGDRFARIA